MQRFKHNKMNTTKFNFTFGRGIMSICSLLHVILQIGGYAGMWELDIYRNRRFLGQRVVEVSVSWITMSGICSCSLVHKIENVTKAIRKGNSYGIMYAGIHTCREGRDSYLVYSKDEYPLITGLLEFHSCWKGEKNSSPMVRGKADIDSWILEKKVHFYA